jgi:hypothetical protein
VKQFVATQSFRPGEAKSCESFDGVDFVIVRQEEANNLAYLKADLIAYSKGRVFHRGGVFFGGVYQELSAIIHFRTQ